MTAARKMQGEATATLSNGEKLTLRYDHNALIAAEDEANCPINVLLERLRVGRMGAARALLFGGLRAHHPELTADDAGHLIVTESAAITPALQEAMIAAFPSGDGAAGSGAEGNDQSTGKSTGKRSSKAG